MNVIFRNLTISNFSKIQVSNIHTTSTSLAWTKAETPRKFLQNNKIIYPPQEIGEQRRPAAGKVKGDVMTYPQVLTPARGDAVILRYLVSYKLAPNLIRNGINSSEFICHQKTNFKYSPEKLWYIASFVRGMTVDEAVKQLSFVSKKGAGLVKEAILEAQEIAVKQHNVEFKSNLWISESFCGKGMVMKGIRRHARGRMGEIRYQYSHYFVTLEEGQPPQEYYKTNKLTPQQQLDAWLEQMRKRKIINSY